MTAIPRPSVRRRTAARRRPVRCALLATALLLVTSCTGGSDGTDGKAGAAGAGDPLFPRLGNGGYDVTHYGLTLDYTPDANRLRATAVLTARATQELGAFNLDLKGLRVRSARVDGEPARTARKGSELTVTPRAALERGHEFETVIVYEGVPKEITDADGESVEGWVETDDGAAALGQPTGSMAWFPGNHHPSDKATYDITVTVPTGYTAVANGELRRKEERDGRTTFSWHNGEPMASYLASVAVNEFEVTTGRAGELPLYIAAHPKEAAAGRKMAKLLPEILPWASGLFGPYPFSSAGAVIDHNNYVDYALETQTKPYFDSAPTDEIVVHELAHQWFGNSVTPRTWRDMWLNESWAQYAEWLWEEKRGGRTVQRIFDDFYDGKDDESPGIWAFPPASPTPETVSDPPVYGRGAMVLHKVRRAVGDDTFFAIARTWAADHRHGNADTAQFIALCEKKSGKDLGALFDTWLFGKGRPAER
ncbi:M1 family metallopeptidase [Streptomyces sp. ISL-11]|uniref:M1 family metallopeptidase n=1 Tax=Streptomyces sp. ISL-11 TaxID=2819174 RepID=UPI001BE56057|nr:M1 family metallopeptidase [Streptomyces sp. ISL-11]MBT2387174.1 M1 family metallopeptidase [Streptomyces sp. ISL-11]